MNGFWYVNLDDRENNLYLLIMDFAITGCILLIFYVALAYYYRRFIRSYTVDPVSLKNVSITRVDKYWSYAKQLMLQNTNKRSFSYYYYVFVITIYLTLILIGLFFFFTMYGRFLVQITKDAFSIVRSLS